jgi:hypothetical protein
VDVSDDDDVADLGADVGDADGHEVEVDVDVVTCEAACARLLACQFPNYKGCELCERAPNEPLWACVVASTCAEVPSCPW